MHLTSTYQLDSVPSGFDGYAITVGPDGTLYSGTDAQYVAVMHPPQYTVDSLIVFKPATEGIASGYQATAVFADRNGWIWVGESGRVVITHGDSVKAYLGEDSLGSNLGVAKRILLAPDSSLWVCGNLELARYNGKYRIPAAALGTTVVQPTSQESSPMSLMSTEGGIRISATGYWSVQIYSVQGRIAWQGQVTGQQMVTVLPGTWVVRALGPQGQMLNKLMGVSR